MLALESHQRKITIAERDTYIAKQDAKDIHRKLNDQLYISIFFFNNLNFLFSW